MKIYHFRRVVVAIGLLTASAGAVRAQDISETPRVTVVISDEGWELPPEIPEGVVSVTYENQTGAPVAPVVTRLDEGVTPEQMEAAFAQEDPAAAQSISSDLGGTAVMPGMSLEISYDFVPGSYFVSNIFGSEAFVFFEVADTEGEGAAAPEADIRIALIDFAYNVPISLSEGTHTVHLENTGGQFHMMILFRLDDSLTIHNVNELLLEDSEELPPGVEEVMTWFPMSEGEQAWIDLTLEAGTYLLLCPLPDMTGNGHAHHHLGMRQTILVTPTS